jgi:hypothetical protein
MDGSLNRQDGPNRNTEYEPHWHKPNEQKLDLLYSHQVPTDNYNNKLNKKSYSTTNRNNKLRFSKQV